MNKLNKMSQTGSPKRLESKKSVALIASAFYASRYLGQRTGAVVWYLDSWDCNGLRRVIPLGLP